MKRYYGPTFTKDERIAQLRSMYASQGEKLRNEFHENQLMRKAILRTLRWVQDHPGKPLPRQLVLYLDRTQG